MYRKKYGEHVYLHWENGLNLLVLFLFFFGLFVCLLTTVIVQLSGSVNLRLWIKKMGFSI